MIGLKDILAEIYRYRVERGWTEYELAERSGMQQSTISSWYRKNMMPTLPSLEKICHGLGISLSQLLAEDDDLVSLTAEQKRLLNNWSRLNEEQRKFVLDLLEKM